jgi:hypothetical protein
MLHVQSSNVTKVLETTACTMAAMVPFVTTESILTIGPDYVEARHRADTVIMNKQVKRKFSWVTESQG